MARRRPSAIVLASLLAAAGCAELGFTSRVLHEVPSPDGRFVAVCQEVPVVDGPEFEVRLHDAKGTFIRDIAYGGDAYPCHEVVWSPDSKWVAVLSRHVSRTAIVDIEHALQQPRDAMLWNRSVSLTWPQGVARNIAFVGPSVVEFDACDAAHIGARGQCRVEYERRRLDISTTPARGVPLPVHGGFRR